MMPWQRLAAGLGCLLACTALGQLSPRGLAPELLLDEPLDPALNSWFVVCDRSTARSFGALPGGSLACFDLAGGRPCQSRPNATIGPGNEVKMLGSMGRSEEDNGITFLMGMSDQAWLVTWPDDTSLAPTTTEYRPFWASVAWQSLNCTGTSGAAADTETTIACRAQTRGSWELWGLTRGGTRFTGYGGKPVAPTIGLRVLLAGKSASPVLRQGGVWSPPQLFGPALDRPSLPFGNDAADAAVLEAPVGLDSIAGVAVSVGRMHQNAFAFAASARSLPVTPDTNLTWTRPLWAPCYLALQVQADSGLGVSAFAVSHFGCLWGRKAACLSLLRTSDGELLWEACGAALSAAAGQPASANASYLHAVFVPGPIAPLITVAVLVNWPSPGLGPTDFEWQYAVVSITLNPRLPGGGSTVSISSLGLGREACRNGDIQAVNGGVVAVLLSGCTAGAGVRLLSLRVAPPVSASSSPSPPQPVSPSPLRASATPSAGTGGPGQTKPVDVAVVAVAVAGATFFGVVLAGAGLWWWAYRRAVPRNGIGLLSHDSMASVVRAPQSIDPADEW